MTEIEILERNLNIFSGMSSEAFQLSTKYWQVKTYKKGDFYNDFHQVCKHLGFIMEGVFRTYYLDEKTANEKTFSFIPKNNCFVR